MFICRHCPFVVHVQEELARLGRDYQPKGVGIVAISANDASAYPDDRPDRLKAMAAEQGFVFPFCYDETQAVAKAYQAVCTPDFFLFDSSRRLVYRGQLDDTRPNPRCAQPAATFARPSRRCWPAAQSIRISGQASAAASNGNLESSGNEALLGVAAALAVLTARWARHS